MKLSKDYKNHIKKQIEKSINVKKQVLEKNLNVINDVSNVFINAFKNGKKVYWMGNGGSAADAQHLACELISKFLIDRDALQSIALTTNSSAITGISNDYSFDKVFERQVEAFVEKNDVLVGISTSGKSKNVTNALKLGKKKGAITISFSGIYKKDMEKYSNYIISIPTDETPRIQESHIMIGHIICEIVENELFGE